MKTPVVQEPHLPHARRAAAERQPAPDTLTPADRYRELFVAVQSRRVFPDSKTFVDCAPRQAPETILTAYRAQHAAPGFDLKHFVETHFDPPAPARSQFVPQDGWTLAQHIDALWPCLTREPEQHPVHGSLLQLPHPYVVPGGRFIEQYYWDSYFTMLGLAESGCAELLHAMTDNFAYLIDTYGHVPDGTRTYYLSRSQPPLFALMTQLCEQRGGPSAHGYLPQLRREHAFWMEGEHHVQAGAPHRRVVRLEDGSVLNRHWDDRDTPREEAWAEDVATAAQSARPPHEVYRHLRATAETGWDFSSRWCREDLPGSLANIHTTDLLPVDLNCFLHELERTIARLARHAGDETVAREFAQRADARSHAIARVFWNAREGIYVDYDWKLRRQRRALTAATVVPLFCGVATAPQAEAVAAAIVARLLAPGGLGTTEYETTEQWDRPNGWAPLQWMAVEGLRRYGHTSLAAEIRTRWMRTVQALFEREHRLVEKYALRPDSAPRGGTGGEYPLQDGFGWTNGVVRRWLHEGAGVATPAYRTP
ncbi:alpha,alpha-trehalase TreF [Ramlibacter sp. XY19]|uniref:alpha,alpha-trehalase TreF n=1 Tax=Ramlibacter paludis TaxID=2908000 RepID=UPI0023DCE7EB|nr:alpha,alpha-trehalase TreF [Ramlibacter paludis]MCG2592329.1 alpha,alpha-trehalase TreF [Ramlibacter paludis]